MKLTVVAEGAADPEVVWDRYTRPDRWSEWSPQIRSVEYPDAVIAAGGRGTVHGPCGVGVAFEILRVDAEKRCWEWRVRAVGADLTMIHGVQPHPAGTRTTLDITGPAVLVVGYAPIARVALGRLLR